MLPIQLLTIASLALTAEPPLCCEFPPLQQVLFDSDAEGRIFAMGNDYKMDFSRDGVTFNPRLGERAPRNLPLEFHLPGGSLPVQDRNRITIDHGSYSEVYDVGLSSVEQSFVLHSRPNTVAGEFELRIPVSTELAFIGRTATGLLFDAAGFASVSYGDAKIIDAAGRTLARESRFTGDSIRISIPENYLETATFPVTIDPVITAITVDAGSDHTRNSDVAYSSLSHDYLFVYERFNSGTDQDILSRRYDSNLVPVDTVLVEGSGVDASSPRVASSMGEFLVVWVLHGSLSSEIHARSRSGTSTSQGTEYQVTNALSSTASDPDVGGANTSSKRFLVVWTENPQFHSEQLHGRLCSDTGTVGSDALLDSAGVFSVGTIGPPSVCQDSGIGHKWAVTYSMNVTGADEQVMVQVFNESLQLLTQGSNYAIASSVDDEKTPNVAGNGFDFYVVYSIENASGQSDIYGQHMDGIGNPGPVGPAVNLTALETPSTQSKAQRNPTITFDGCRYTYGYLEAPSLASNDTNLFLATFMAPPASSLVTFIEKHAPLATLSLPEREVRLTSAGVANEVGDVVATWTTEVTLSDNDIRAALYSNLGAGGVTVAPTGCGSPEPVLLANGTTPAIASTFQFVVSGANNPLLVVGVPTNLSLCPGQGGCKLGATPLLMLPIAGVSLLDIAIPCDPNLLGFTAALQIVDLVAPGATGALCGPPKYSQKFRTSDTTNLTFQ